MTRQASSAILEAVERLLSEGFQPTRTIYLAFGHDEEIGGANGAAKIAATLAARNVQLEFVLDEGMNILSGVIEGVNTPVALIGVAEKGYLSVQLSANAVGGHSSIPPAITPSTASAEPCSDSMRRHSRRDSAARPVRCLITSAPKWRWSQKLVLANLWLFEPLICQSAV